MDPLLTTSQDKLVKRDGGDVRKNQWDSKNRHIYIYIKVKEKGHWYVLLFNLNEIYL